MKLLVLSDVHANFDALQPILEKEADADLVLSAGDLVHYGYNPHECVQAMKKCGAICIAGNHDEEIVANRKEGLHEPVGQETSFATYTLNRLTEDDLHFLETLPETANFEADGISYCMRHAFETCEHINHFQESVIHRNTISEFERIWNTYADGRAKKRTLILAHSHDAFIFQVKQDCFVVNPGTLNFKFGADRGEEPVGTYMTIENGIPILKSIDYSREHIRELDGVTQRFK